MKLALDTTKLIKLLIVALAVMVGIVLTAVFVGCSQPDTNTRRIAIPGLAEEVTLYPRQTGATFPIELVPRIPYPPPPNRWQPIAHVTAARDGAKIVNPNERDNWSYSVHEVVNEVVRESKPGDKITVFYSQDPLWMQWTFNGHILRKNLRGFLYGVEIVDPNGTTRREMRVHGSAVLSSWDAVE